MNNETQLEIVLQKIDELRLMVEKHLDNPKMIPKIESALVMEKLQFAYDVYYKLANQAIPVPENKLEEIVQENKKEEEISKPQLENTIEDLEEAAHESVITASEEETVILSVENETELFPDQQKETETKEPKAIEPEERKEDKSEKVIEPKSEEKEIKPEIKTPHEENIDLFSTTFDSEVKTVAEEISEKVNEESVADKFKNNKITDLKEAIGINEKFYFINELFDGVMKEYNEAIESLNTHLSKEEAFNYLNQLKEERDWNEGSEALGQLKDILERKFN